MYNLIIKALKIVPQSIKPKLLFLQLVLLFSAVLELMGVVSVGPFVALALNPAHVYDNPFLSQIYKLLGAESEKQFLMYTGLVFGAFFIGSNAFLLLNQVLLSKISNSLQAAFSDRLYRYYLNKNYLYHVQHRAGTLISKINNDTGRLCNGLILAFLQINSRLFSIFILIVLLLLINYKAASLIGFVIVGAYIIIYIYTNFQLKENGRLRTYNDRYRSRILQESFEGVKTLLFYGLQDKYARRLESTFNQRIKLNVADKLLKDLPYFAIESVAFSLIITVIYLLFTTSDSPERAISELSIICLAGYRLIPKFQQVYRSIATVKSNQHPFNQLYTDLVQANKELHPGVFQDKGDICFVRAKGFELTRISFSYKDNIPILQGVDFFVPPGEVVGIIGVSGVGKSTLMSIMTGMLPTTSGIIRYDGQILTEGQLQCWRRFVGYVDSETYLFEGSLLDNILMGRDENSEKLKMAIKISCVHRFVGELEHGLNTDVGSKGARLSSGQRQRIGLARAIYSEPSILFLDEATNALDYDTQQEVIKNIKMSGWRPSVVVVSHRLDMRENFDRIYTLNKAGLTLLGL